MWQNLTLALCFGCLLNITLYSQNFPRLVSPIDGIYGKDFVLIHYIDQDTTEGFRDPYCGTKTYNGHLGHDFAIRSFREMDSGVTVLAAHDGVVVKVVDGLFDRNKEDTAFGYGNYVVILHESGLTSVYAHLKRNSIRVRFGDRVSAGDPIAQIGSSGRSSDPHLHFELWYDDMLWWRYWLVNPFDGQCSAGKNLWQDPFPYDTSLIILGSGLLNFVPTLGELKEHPESQTIFRHSDTAICFWIHLHGLRAGDSLRLEWRDPYGILWFAYSSSVDADKWYYYWWSYIHVPPPGYEGIWTVRLYRNEDLIFERPFRVAKTVATADTDSPSLRITAIRNTPHCTLLSLDGIAPMLPYTVFNARGQIIHSGRCQNNRIQLTPRLPSGKYWLRIQSTTLPFVIMP